MPIYRWFRADLTFPDLWSRDIGPGVAERIRRHLGDDPERKRVLVELLATADAGIADFEFVSVEEDRRVLRQSTFRARSNLVFRHAQTDGLFDFLDESAGTRSWLSLLPDALDALEVGGAMVIDEIDASLHPLLTARLIGLFREADTNPRGAQLIFTTHDASLLGTALGEEVLARDQIWFVEKDRNGASGLYPLSDFKPREGENRERRYLSGSYGAVPVVSSTEFADAVH